MESKDLLRPDNDENQNFEVNAGSSNEDQSLVESNESTIIENESENKSGSDMESQILPIEEQANETPLVEETSEFIQPVETEKEPLNVDTVEQSVAMETLPSSDELDSVNGMMSDIESTQKENETEEENEEDEVENAVESIEDIEKEYSELAPEAAVEELERIAAEPDYNKTKKRVGILKAKILVSIKNYI